jgi:hypothetical protein
MWFIAIGGMERTLKKLIGSIVAPFTEKAYINSVLGGLFMMRKNRDPEDEEDDEDPSKPYGPKKVHVKTVPEFVTKQEGVDYWNLVKDIQNNKLSKISVRNILTHLFKNRTKFNVAMKSKTICQMVLTECCPWRKRKRAKN